MLRKACPLPRSCSWSALHLKRLRSSTWTTTTDRSKRSRTLSFTGKGQWIWRFIQDSDKISVRDLCNEAVGEDDYVPLHIEKLLGHRNFYALGAEINNRLVHVVCYMSQDDGKTLYSFGIRTHPLFQGKGNVSSSLLPATEKLIIHSYESGVERMRLWIDPTLVGSVTVAMRSGYKRLYHYECSRYQHHNLTECQNKLNQLRDSMGKQCVVRSVDHALDFSLIGPIEYLTGLEIIASSFLPASVFFSPDFVLSATRSNLEIIQKQLGYQVLVSGREESGHWTPRALSYGGKADCTLYPTWSSTLTGDTRDDILSLLLVQVQLALDHASSSRLTENTLKAQIICCFNSLEVKRLLHYALCDLLGFVNCEQFLGDGNYKQCAIFERHV